MSNKNINEGKNKYMGIKIGDDDIPTISRSAASGKSVEVFEDFVYVGSRMKFSEKVFEVRKAKAWAACPQMKI